MSEKLGYVKIHRCIEENELWLKEKFSRGQAWLDMILLANHKDSSFYVRDISVDVKRGQLAWSQVKIAKRWRWSRKKLQNFLKMLESSQQIEIHKSNVINIVTITNYDKYQCNGAAEEQQKSSRRAHTMNDKNVKNIYSAEKSSAHSLPKNKNPQVKTPTECKTKYGMRNLTAPIKYLNKVTGKKFRVDNETTLKLIRARYAEGATPEDFKFVINNKCAEWGDTDMEKYLRPKTLFLKSNWENYINERPSTNSAGTINPL